MQVRSRQSAAGAHPGPRLALTLPVPTAVSAPSHAGIYLRKPISVTGRRCADSHKLCCRDDALRLIAINSPGDEGFFGGGW